MLLRQWAVIEILPRGAFGAVRDSMKSELTARAEAERMARERPPGVFAVFKMIGAYRASAVAPPPVERMTIIDRGSEDTHYVE